MESRIFLTCRLMNDQCVKVLIKIAEEINVIKHVGCGEKLRKLDERSLRQKKN